MTKRKKRFLIWTVSGGWFVIIVVLIASLGLGAVFSIAQKWEDLKEFFSNTFGLEVSTTYEELAAAGVFMEDTDTEIYGEDAFLKQSIPLSKYVNDNISPFKFDNKTIGLQMQECRVIRPSADETEAFYEQAANEICANRESMTEDEAILLNDMLNQYVAENTRETIEIVDYDYVLDGEGYSALLNNKYHTPWQSLYVFSLMVQIYANDAPEESETDMEDFTDWDIVITKDVYNAVCEALKPSVKLTVDIFGESFPKSVSYNNYKTVLTGTNGRPSYTEWEIKNPEEDVVWRKGFTPVPALEYADTWALRYSFSDISINSAETFPAQHITNTDISDCLINIMSQYEFNKGDLNFIRDHIEALMDSEPAVRDIEQSEQLAENGTFDRFKFDMSMFTNLSAGELGSDIVLKASEHIGWIYSQPNRNKTGYHDCSSLTYWVYSQFGYNISSGGSNVAAQQALWCEENKCIVCDDYPNEPDSILEAGDLIFWSRAYSTGRHNNIYHVGIYVGDDMIIDASSSLGRVVLRSMWGKNQVICVARPGAVGP